MDKCLDCTAKPRDSQISPIGRGIIIIFLGTAFFTLMTPSHDFIIPYAPYLQLGLQVGISALLAIYMRIRIRSISFYFLMGFFALFMIAIVSSFLSLHPYLVLQRASMVFLTSLLICVLALSDNNPAVTFYHLAKSLALFGATICLVGLVIYFFGKLDIAELGYVQSIDFFLLKISQNVYGSYPFLRMSSLLYNPNTLASWLIITLTMTGYLISAGSRRTTWRLIMFIQTVALILTFSRAGILATLASLGLFWYLSAGNKRLRNRRAFMLVFLTLILALILMLYIPMLPQSDRISMGLSQRDLIWGITWTSICENPILGIGFGVSYESILAPNGIDFTVHNAFLSILSEIGLPGFLLFLSLWLIPMWCAYRRLKLGLTSEGLVLATCLAVTLSYIFHQMFELNILRYGFQTLIWAYMLTLMVHPRLSGNYNLSFKFFRRM